MIGRSAMLGLLALGLFGCAHAPHEPTLSYLGGRAGQPGGWPSEQIVAPARADYAAMPFGRVGQPGSWAPTRRAAAPATTLAGDSYLGGRMEQPQGWPVRQ